MTKVKFNKPALTIREQAELLISRGLIVSSLEGLIVFLNNVSYYRFSAYFYPFLRVDGTFRPDTRFELIHRRYIFDRRFRVLILDGIERVEIAVKTRIANVFSLAHGAFGYLEKSNFNKFREEDCLRFEKEIELAIEKKGQEYFINHFRNKYSDFCLPIWMVMEVISYGTMSIMFKYMNRNEQYEIAQDFELPVAIFVSWLHTLNSVRNVCAHHERLWNRRLCIAPKLLRGEQYASWKNIDERKIFAVLLIISYLLKYCAPNTHWRQRVEALVREYSDLPFDKIGFPDAWQEHPAWRL